jgi:hypothetical protein
LPRRANHLKQILAQRKTVLCFGKNHGADFMSREEEIRQLAIAATQMLRSRVRWKPGKDVEHLAKRIRQGHLKAETSMSDYNRIISELLLNDDSAVYHYPFDGDDYFGLVGEFEDKTWLIILGANGLMETAFPPKEPTSYLIKRGFVYLGKMKEISP